jgi:hypothetical protein
MKENEYGTADMAEIEYAKSKSNKVSRGATSMKRLKIRKISAD